MLINFWIKKLNNEQILDLMEIIEDRHGRKATVVESQIPVADWYDCLETNTTAADAILDRMVHSAIRFELKGESLRKKSLTLHREKYPSLLRRDVPVCSGFSKN